MPTKEDLSYFQSMPLDIKVAMTKTRIHEWVNYFGVGGTYISFSGGKDSTVLLHLVRELYPDIPAVFVNTGLEYPEIQKFVKQFDNVIILYPKIRFIDVIKNYGYPIISKEVTHKISYARKGSEWALKFVNGLAKDENGNKSRYNVEKYKDLLNVDFLVSDQCCTVMKKEPVHRYAKTTGRHPITAQMASESMLRTQKWIQNGCNAFDIKQPISNPMSFWNENDVLQYIIENKLPIASVYGDIIENGTPCKYCTTGCKRTGCMFCGFGAHLETNEGRFEILKKTHPKQYDYCMGGGSYDDKGIWKPNENGLGIAHVIDTLNSIYGKDFIKK